MCVQRCYINVSEIFKSLLLHGIKTSSLMLKVKNSDINRVYALFPVNFWHLQCKFLFQFLNGRDQ